jgi:hypothetical protein
VRTGHRAGHPRIGLLEAAEPVDTSWNNRPRAAEGSQRALKNTAIAAVHTSAPDGLDHLGIVHVSGIPHPLPSGGLSPARGLEGSVTRASGPGNSLLRFHAQYSQHKGTLVRSAASLKVGADLTAGFRAPHAKAMSRYGLGGHPKPAINRHLKTGN